MMEVSIKKFNLFVFFPIDGSASYNSEFHQATLQNLGHGFAVLTKLSRLLEGKA